MKWPLFPFFFFKVFIEFVTILLLFYIFWFFGHEAYGTLVPRPRMQPAPLALEGEVLTTGPPGKSRPSFSKSLGPDFQTPYGNGRSLSSSGNKSLSRWLLLPQLPIPFQFIHFNRNIYVVYLCQEGL